MSFQDLSVRFIFAVMKEGEEKKDDESKKDGIDSLELIIKRAEAKTARLRFKREKLFHKKILEIAGYDNKGSI